jgi:hypothetical protein
MAKSYENFPVWMVVLSNAVSLSIYAIGVYVLLAFGLLFAALYILYCLWVELKVLRSCRNCYYYGRRCCFGKGKICSVFFKKGNARAFTGRKVSAKDVIPDFLVSIFPIIGAVVILVTSFSWLVLALLLVLAILSFGGSAFVRGSLACNHCRQREMGCPAQKLFSKR